MVTVNLPKFGKIKTNGVWCDFHESNVITGTISDDYCKIKIEEFKPKMNTYKIISGEAHPTLERLMASQSEVKSESLREACCKFMKTQLGYEFFGYILHVETLNLFYVQYFRELDGREYFREYHKGKLEKPKMKKYKIIPNQNKHPDSITYEFMMDHFTVESDSPINAFRNYCEHDTFGLNLDSTFGYVLDVESLDLYYTSWSVNEQIGHSSFVMKLENPIEKPKMNKYKLSCKHTHIQDSSVVIEARHPSEAVIKYCEQFQYMNIHMYAMNIETLVVFEIFWKKDINGKVTTWTVQTDYIPEIKTKPMNSLSFKTLTEANNKRLPLFKNSKGLPAHSTPDGSDWSHAEWLQAVIGELGEYANIMKKVQRGDLTMEEAKPSIEKELADVMTYFAILAQQLNVDLGQAVEDKFNEVSKRVKANVFIKDDKVFSKDEKPEDEYVVHCDEYHSHSFERGCMIKVKKDEDKTRKAKDFMASDKEKLKVATDKVKVKPNAWSSNANYITNIYFTDHYYKDQIHKKTIGAITLQCLSSLRNYRYKQENMNIEESTILDAIGQDILGNNCKLSKLLINGNIRVNGYKLKLGDMIQFTDERNVLYSFRVTELL